MTDIHQFPLVYWHSCVCICVFAKSGNVRRLFTAGKRSERTICSLWRKMNKKNRVVWINFAKLDIWDSSWSRQPCGNSTISVAKLDYQVKHKIRLNLFSLSTSHTSTLTHGPRDVESKKNIPDTLKNRILRGRVPIPNDWWMHCLKKQTRICSYVENHLENQQFYNLVPIIDPAVEAVHGQASFQNLHNVFHRKTINAQLF